MSKKPSDYINEGYQILEKFGFKLNTPFVLVDEYLEPIPYFIFTKEDKGRIKILQFIYDDFFNEWMENGYYYLCDNFAFEEEKDKIMFASEKHEFFMISPSSIDYEDIEFCPDTVVRAIERISKK